MSTLKIAWRNLGRSRLRTGFALAAIAIGQFALLLMAGLMNGYKDQILKAITGPLIGDVQMHVPEWRDERAMDLALADVEATLGGLRRDPRVANAFARIYAPALAAPERDAEMVVVVGVDPEMELRSGGLVEGAPGKLAPGRVLVGGVAAERLGAKPGVELAIIGQGADGSIANDLYTVAGLIESQVDFVNRQGVIMTLADAQELFVMADQAHEILVHAAEREGAEALAKDLAMSAALEGTEVLSWRQLAPELSQMVEMIDYSVFFVLIFVFVAAVAGVANTMLMSTFERTHEFGMLLALGARPARIVAMIFVEAVLLGVVGAAVGTALGYGVVGLTSSSGLDIAALGGEAASDISIQGMRLPLLVYPWVKLSDVLIGVAAVVATSVLAAVWPSVIAARLEPVEALHE